MRNGLKLFLLTQDDRRLEAQSCSRVFNPQLIETFTVVKGVFEAFERRPTLPSSPFQMTFLSPGPLAQLAEV